MSGQITQKSENKNFISQSWERGGSVGGPKALPTIENTVYRVWINIVTKRLNANPFCHKKCIAQSDAMTPGSKTGFPKRIRNIGLKTG